ncbi:MAG: AAA family ATPase [Clostridiaceae bacterium]|nr:AAA family ATPase [Clostridiaceae bacterium]MDY5888920.1 AAA family ATPase [Oscillospiraceae bacterium]
MAKIIAVVNQKGGVGKTTSTVNLAASVALKGQKVLLMDIDPQGNATSGLGVNKRELETSSYDVIVNALPIEKVIRKTEFENLWVLPSNMNLAGAELELVDMKHRESKIKNAVAPIKSDFDFIFLDCPPSLGLITLNALCAADTVLVPIQCEYYALEGLSQLMSTIRQVKRLYNPHIEMEGVLLTMYDGRLNLTQQVVGELKRFFPKKVYATAIPRNVKLSEAPSYGLPIHYYDKNSKGAAAYDALADEFLKLNGKGVI